MATISAIRRLPVRLDAELHMVVVKRPGAGRPMMLRTALRAVRMLKYERLKNMASLVAAVAYFAAAWIGKGVRLEALANHVAQVSRKMFEAPEFFYYAIADGIRCCSCNTAGGAVSMPTKNAENSRWSST